MKTFDVTMHVFDNGEKEMYTINPMNVTLLRRVYDETVLHAEGCTGEEDGKCPFFGGIADVDEPVLLHNCRVERGTEKTQILLVNTVSPNSSVVCMDPLHRVKELLNDSLR